MPLKTMIMSSLLGKHIIITGATSGIGKSLVIKLLSEGAQLSICGLSTEKMKMLLDELPSEKLENIYYKTFSIDKEQDIIDFVTTSFNKFKKIDYLINCAGLNSAKGNIVDIKTSDLDWMISINLRAPFIFMREVFKYMKERKEGTVINVLSSVCLFSNEGMGAYTASKAGFEAMTKVFRKEAANDGVKVCAVYPGGVNTPFRAIERKDYMSPESTAEAIVSFMKLPDDIVMHEIVFRPMVERNF